MNESSLPVRIHLYNPLWPVQYWLESFRLRVCLSGHILDIAHTGSTSIPGMPAKPVIDISIAVKDYEAAWKIIPSVKSLGYKYQGENRARREYSLEKFYPFAYAIFICEPGSEKWLGRLRFRDYLRTHPSARREYAQLKQNLAQEFADDLLAYQRAKLPFVQKILSKTTGLSPG